MTGSRALLLVGGGSTADPWHDFSGTGARAEAALVAAGFAVEVAGDPLERLTASFDADLVVLTIGAGFAGRRDAVSQRRAVANLMRHRDAGRGVVALHAALTAMTEVAEWTTLLGGRWVEGTSMHPPFGPTDVDVATDAHPVTAGVRSFRTIDERYSFLAMAPGSQVLASHVLDGFPHPLVWTAAHAGPGRVATIALGHAPESWDAPELPRLLRNAAGWAAGGDAR